MAKKEGDKRGRQKGDGKGRMGGRQAGTPNKETSLKPYLRQHSEQYFSPVLTWSDLTDEKEQKRAFEAFGEGQFSRFDLHLLGMKYSEVVDAELTLLKYHTPQMQAVQADMAVKANKTLSDRLVRLAAGEDIPSEAG